jgi:hypothetical protein
MKHLLQQIGMMNFQILLIPGLMTLFILTIEPLILSLRLWLLIPKEHGITAIKLSKAFFKGQLIGHFSIPTLGDLYRFRKLGKLGNPPPSVANRIQYLALERFSESLTIPLVGLAFTTPSAVRKMIPMPPGWVLPVIAAVVMTLLIVKRKRTSTSLEFNLVRPRDFLLACAISASGWILDLMALKALTSPYSIPTSELMLALIGVSVSSIPPLPWGRWGLFEGILGAALHQSGIPAEQAFVVATVFHVLMVVPFVIGNLVNWKRL